MLTHFAIVLLDIYKWVLLIRVLLSWVEPNPYNPLVRGLYDITDPLLDRIRALIPPIGGMIDISPIIAFFLISLVQQAFAGFGPGY